MTNLARITALCGLLLLGACASDQNAKDPMATGSVAMKCVISGEPVDGDSPSVDYQGTKVMFCCKDCQKEFEKLDDAGKQAKVASMK